MRIIRKSRAQPVLANHSPAQNAKSCEAFIRKTLKRWGATMKDKAPILFTRLEPTDPETLDWTPDFNLWAARLINDNVSLFTDISDAGEILGRECFFLEELVELIRPPQNTLLHEAVSFLYRCVGQSRPPQITRDYQYYLTVEGDLTRSYEHEESRLTYAYYATVRDGTKKGTLKNAKRAARTLDYEYQILRCQQTRVRVTMSLLLKWLEGGFPATQQEKENPPARIDWANNPELVKEIELMRSKGYSHAKIAKKEGLTRSMISNMLRRRQGK